MRAILLFFSALLCLTGATAPLAASERPPECVAAAQDCLLAAEVGPPFALGSLVLYPVRLPPSLLSSHGLWPIDRAMGAGVVSVADPGVGDGPGALSGRNTGGTTVFGQGGGFFQGGGQDRGGGRSFLMSPREDTNFPVYCVEYGRSEGSTTAFLPEGYALAHPVLRGCLALGDQERIWREVARERRVLGASEETGASYRGVEQADPARQARARLGLLSPAWSEGAAGVLVAAGNRVIGLDLYGDPRLMSAQRDLLLRSYALVNAELAEPIACTVGPDDARAFLADAAGARWRLERPLGAGEYVALGMRWHAGGALLWNGGLVHLGLYDTRPIVDR